MHFFIDHAQLPTQSQTDGKFCPIDGQSFNITTNFRLTSAAKAFACQDGQMIVQQSSVDDSLVNIILRPIKGLNIPFDSIQYYVYRGVQKNSFMSGTEITPAAANNTDFIARFWKAWNDFNTPNDQSAQTNPAPQCLGYDNLLAGSLDIKNIYNNEQEAKAIYVKEGEWIGNFGNAFPIGFEIISEDKNLTVDLNYLRAEKITIKVAGLTGFELKTKREQVLAFIDPAAFFGMHYEVGISVATYNGTEKTTQKKKQDEIYNLLLSKFATKNTVYLDIRSEHGYSYNFHANYDDGLGNNIKVGNSLVVPTAQKYLTNNWPILTINTPLATTNNKNDIKINLRIDDNQKPILFFENPELISGNKHSRFIADTEIVIKREDDTFDYTWSKDLSFIFPNTGTGTEKENVAYYIQLYYFRQQYNPASPNTVLKNENYFDSAFCPIDLPALGSMETVIQHIFNPDKIYVAGILPDTRAEFGYIADGGAFWDNDRIIFYSQAVFAAKISKQSIPSVPKFAINPGFNIAKGSFLNRDISIVNNKLDENGNDVNLIELIHSNAIIASEGSVILLCLTQTEFNRVTQSIGLSDKHSKYIYIEELIGSPFTDTKGIPFRKFALKLQGLDDNGFHVIVSPETSVHVYSKDGFLFNSKDFGNLEGINNIEKISNIYGATKVYRWIGYIDDPRAINVVPLLESTCTMISSIFPSLLYTIAIGEGLNLWIAGNYSPAPPHNVVINNRINGFDYLGTDDFGSDFARYKPFLPNTYNEGDEFIKMQSINEHGQVVISADFKNLESGLLGIGAVIAHRKNKFLSDALELGYGMPNIDQIFFWTYVYFQGEGRAKRYLQENKDFDFSKKAPSNMTQIRKLALERLATWRYIKTSNILSV